jgi:DNA-binding GntR family transcriptional regulator
MRGKSPSGEPAKQLAIEGVRRAILRGELVAGQRLIEPDLAEMLGVNRSSVRAALIDLAAEGLVERMPNKGARVRIVPVAEAIAINECRRVLDGLCAAKAADRASDEEIAELRAYGEQMREAVLQGRFARYSQLNMDLHQRIREISGQFVAERLVQRLNEQVVQHQFHLAADESRARAWLPEHLAVIDAIARHDAKRAERATRLHMDHVIAVLRSDDLADARAAAG